MTDPQWAVLNGEYTASDSSTDAYMQSTYTEHTWQDCYAQVTMRREGYAYSMACLFVRASADFSVPAGIGQAYSIGITGTGYFWVGKYLSGVYYIIQGWTSSPYLNTAAPNVVGLSVQGSTLEVYLNGNLAWSGEDSDIPGPGHVGVYGLTQVAYPTVHYFDDIHITRQVETAMAPSATSVGAAESVDAVLPASAALPAASEPCVCAVEEPKDPAPTIPLLQAVPLSTGGPDAGGYYFVDSDEPGGPAFDWIDISATGTDMNMYDDTRCWPISLPFVFAFYGTGYNHIAIGSNGVIYFDSDPIGYENSPIPGPNAYGIDKLIAVYWDDLDPGAGGQVLHQIVGSAPNRIMVVQWENVRHYGSSIDTVTVQAQLFEGSSDILLLYADPSSEAGSGATIGIQGGETSGLQYLYNQAGLHENLAIRFSHADVYDLYFWSGDPDVPPAIPTVSGLFGQSWDPGPLEPLTTYYWQVVTRSNCGQTPGPIWSFVTVLCGDIDADGAVNVTDLQLLASAWAAHAGPPTSDDYSLDADLNADGYVNVGDLQLLVGNWASTVSSVSGTVRYSAAPQADIRVELRSEGSIAAVARTDQNGEFLFPAVAEGNYELRSYGPTDDYIGWTGHAITVSGSDLVEDLRLVKKIVLLTPADLSTVATARPTLTWTPVSGAVSYTIQVNVSSSWELVEMVTGIMGPSYTLSQDLADGVDYTWMVDGYDATGWIASSSAAFHMRLDLP